jgi:hypothetical protein
MSVLGPCVGALLSLSSGPVGLDGPRIAWTVDRAVSCPTVAELQAAYALETSAQSAAPPRDAIVKVALERTSKGVLRLTVSTTTPVFEAQSDIATKSGRCDELAQTVVIVLHALLRDLPELFESEEISPLPLPPPVASAPAPPTLSVARTPEAPPSVHPDRPALRLCAGADAFVGSSTVPALTLGVEFGLSRRWSVETLVSLLQNQSFQDQPYGSLRVQSQLFGALAIFTVYQSRPRGFSVDALAGPVLWHGHAQSFGYPTSAPQQLFDPGLMAGARIRQGILGRFFLQGQLAGIVYTRAIDLQVDRPGGAPATVAVFENLALDLSAGVGMNLF